MSNKPVILYDSGNLSGLSGTLDGQVLKWNAAAQEWVAGVVEGTGTVTQISTGGGLTGGPILTTGTISMETLDPAPTGTYGSATEVARVTVDQYGRTTAVTATSIQIAQSQVTNLGTALDGKVNTTVSVAAGSGLTGGGLLTESRTIALQDVSTGATPPGLLIPNTYGSAAKVGQFTVNAYGITTFAADVDILITESQVTDLTTHLNDKVPTTRSVSTTTGQLAGGGNLSADLTLGLAEITPAINGTKGSGTAIPVLKIDVYGRVTESTDTTVTLAGDVTGDVTASTVAKIQGRDVSGTAPTAGQALVWSGSAWAPATIQGGGGGGGSGGLTYYFNQNKAPQGLPLPPNSSQLSLEYDTVGGPYEVSLVAPNGGNHDVIAQFITDVGDPGKTLIPPGIWSFGFYALSTSDTNSYVRVRLGKWDDTTSTLAYIGVPSDEVEITHTTTPAALFEASLYVPQTDLDENDRIAVIFEVSRTVSAARTITLSFNGTTPAHAHTTLGAPGGTGVVKVVNGIVQDPASLIENADIKDTAAIAVSKLSGTATAGYYLKTNGNENGAYWAEIGAGTGSVTEVTAGTGLQVGDGTGSSTITGAGTLNLTSTGVTANPYGGDAAKTVGFTVDAQGRLSAASTLDIAIGIGAVTNLQPALDGKVPTTRRVTAGDGLTNTSGGNTTKDELSADLTISADFLASGGTNGTATKVPRSDDKRFPPAPSTYGKIIYDTGSAYAATATAGTTGQPLLANQGPAPAAPAFGALALGASEVNVTGRLTAANGGTGFGTGSTYTVGDILYASGATALSKLAAVATGNVLISGGLTTAPSWGKVNLDSTAAPFHVSGTLRVGNGGTGLASGTSGGIPYFSSASAMTSSAVLTQYGVVYGGGAGGAPVTTAVGTAGYPLLSNGGTGGSPAPAFGQLDLAQTSPSAPIKNVLPVANGGTGKGGTGDLWTANGAVVVNSAGTALTTVNPTNANKTYVLTSDGTQWTPVAIPYDISGVVTGLPTASSVIFRWASVRKMILSGDGTKHLVIAATSALNPVTFTLWKNSTDAANKIFDAYFDGAGTSNQAAAIQNITANTALLTLDFGDALLMTSPADPDITKDMFFTFYANVTG